MELDRTGQWQRAAMIACILANTNRDTKKRSQPFAVEDFMPTRGPRSETHQTPEQQAEMLKLIAIGLGGTVGV